MRKKKVFSGLLVHIAAVLLALIPAWAEAVEDEVVIRTTMAEYDEETGRIYAQGESTITWQGVTMVCPYLELDTRTQEATSSGEIIITWEGARVEAQEMFFSGEKNQARLSRVRGVSDEYAFSAAEVDFDFTGERMVMKGDPLLELSEYTVRALSIEHSFPSKAWFASSVTLTRPGWEGRSSRAVFREGDDVIELSGDARIRREDSTLRGEKVLVFLETGRVRVEGDVEITITQ